jgi:hypothetical protein
MHFVGLCFTITLHYVTLHYITFIRLHYITLRYITLSYVTLHFITLHYITLRYITLRYITLRYITLPCTVENHLFYNYIHFYQNCLLDLVGLVCIRHDIYIYIYIYVYFAFSCCFLTFLLFFHVSFFLYFFDCVEQERVNKHIPSLITVYILFLTNTPFR